MVAAAGGGRLSSFLRSQRKLVWIGLYFTSIGCTLKIINEHVYQFESCDGPSMFPTLHRYGDSLVISKLYRYGRGIGIGDIIVYKQPQFSQMIGAKRVLGMPGDYVLSDVPSEQGEPDVNEESHMLQVRFGSPSLVSLLFALCC